MPEKPLTCWINWLTPTLRFFVITKIELLGNRLTSVEWAVFGRFTNSCTIHELTNVVVDTASRLRQRKNVKVPDAIIATTAISHNLIVLTRNTGDFKGIAALKRQKPGETHTR